MKTKPAGNDQINVITLGCSKNLVDSEVLLSQLRASGKQVSHEDPNSKAGTVVINTCGFIDKAKEQSIRTIYHYVNLKKAGVLNKVYVTGCLSQRYGGDLKQEIPEVDGYFGTNDLPDLLGTLGADYKKELLGEREVTSEGHYAYLKISEGCNRGCSFCAIPLMRGKHQSREIEFLVREAEYLVSKGVKEIMLIAQDLTYYGLDIYGKRRLDDLLTALANVKGLAWLRLHYAYPAGFPAEILPIIRDNPVICNYLDMPLQHVSDHLLRKMRRAINRDRMERLIDRIRSEIPGITIRTTLLVGHPGETKEDHAELLAFLGKHRFDRVGAFTYSHEEDTHSFEFEDDVPAEIKQERFEDIMALQQKISLELNQKKIGTVQRTIIDRKEKDHFVGRTEGDSPEVDNSILVRTPNLGIGNFYDVAVTAAQEYDLIGHVQS